MTARDVVAGGVRLHVVEAGAGPALVLLHGLAASHAIWQHVVPALAGRWRVVAPDLPGHGASDKPDAGYGIAYHARVVRALGEVLGLRDVVIAGSSLGGRIALQLAADHPEWVRAAVLAAPARDYPSALALAWGAVAWLASPAVVRAALVGGVRRSFYDPGGPGCAARRRILDERLAADDFAEHARAVVRSIAGALDAERAVAARVRQPALVTWGRQDRIVPFACSESLLRLMPHARLQVFERCGHIPMLEHPEAFVGALQEFLDGLEAAPRHAAGGH